MSVEICSEATINALAQHSPAADKRERQLIAVELVRVNALAYAERYGSETVPVSIRYAGTPRAGRLTAVEVLKLCDHYEYQACSAPCYTKTQAARYIHRIRVTAIAGLPGYDEAPWGLE